MELESQAKRLFEALGDAHILVDRAGQIQLANQRALDQLRSTCEQLLEQSLGLLLASRGEQVMERCRQHEPHRANGVLLRRGDESRLCADLELTPITLSGRALMLVHIRSVEGQLASERDEALERFEEIFASTHMAVAYLDRDMRFVRVNRAYATACNETPEYFVGKGHFELYPHAENEAIFRRVVETGDRYAVRAKPFEHPDQIERGTTYWDWTATATRNATGDIDGLLLCLVDSTEHIRAELARRTSEESLRGLLDALPDGICVAHSDRLAYANPALAALTGWPIEALLERRLEDLLPEDELEQLLRRLQLPGAGATDAHSFDLVGANDTRRVEAWASLVVYQREASTLCVFRDSSERRRLEQQLHQAQRLEAIGRLAGGVAHDFNNLLTVIITNLFLAIGALPDKHQVRDWLEEVYGASQRASDLTRQLLAFARKQQLDPQPLEVNEVASTLEAILQHLVGVENRLVLDLEPTPPVHLDRSQLEQILLNMATNARQAMSSGGQLTISTRTVQIDESIRCRLPKTDADTAVRLRIADNGSGMAPAVAARAFEPFFTTRGDSDGTGLGLATVYGSVKQSGGCIEIHSEPAGGTCFEILFPATTKPAAHAGADEASPDRVRGDERVLIVDDDPAVRRSARLALELYGYQVMDTDGLDGALSICRHHPERVDLLLTDVVLMGQNGLDVSRAVRELVPDISVLYMSGYPSTVLQQHGVAGEEIEIVPKPFTPYTLSRMVRQLLDLSVGAGSPGRT